MNIEKIMLGQWAGGQGELYGSKALGIYAATIAIGFFCIEDWGPWT